IMADDRGIKHFDRKFVASNLKNLLHCPKCSTDYTHSQDDQKHRPFLLPCGHSLCENCLSADRQRLTCAVCKEPADPLINPKNPASKSGVQVSDFYELNYHVLGEASSLTSCPNLDTKPVNEAPGLGLENKVVILTTKCRECRSEDAKGICIDCKLCFCRKCFDKVHMCHVLKSHRFKNMAGRQPTGFPVGDQMFRLPYPRECDGHRLPKTIYCSKCRHDYCTKCSDLEHSSHRTQPIVEINKYYVSKIPSTMQALNSAQMNIHNGQEVVRATKQKLTDYASETMASVSKHFSHLHGLLQVAELQVVEKLRVSSLPPQIELNEAMRMLSDYEKLIKHLKQYLESGVPNDVWLKEIIRLVKNHLEKIPSTVQVSQIKTNPYRISCDHLDILSIMDQTFKCKFVDPMIKVCFKTKFERDRSISSIINTDLTSSLSFSSGKENTCRSNIQESRKQLPLTQKSFVKSMPNSQQRQGKNSTKSSLNSTAATIDSFQPKDYNSQSIVGSFSALDIAKANSTTRGSRKIEWFKTDPLVKVRSINSPEDFYVQGVRAMQEEVSKELDTITHSLLFGEILVGQHYIILHQDHNRYYRAMVSQKMATQDTYKVFLPDIGLYTEMQNSQFHEMPERLSQLPYAAMHCSLRELMPKHGANSEWDSEAITLLKRIVKNNPVDLIVKKALSHDLQEVDLITNNYKTKISVRESFLYSGLASSRCGRSPVVVLKSLQQTAPPNLRLPRPKLQTGDIFMIQMMHVEHPQEFYVMRHDLESERWRNRRNLQGHMEGLSLSTLENIFLGRLHLGCVLQSGDQWKRASIEEILSDGYVRVRLVDDGPCQEVYWDKLFVLPSAFWGPERTIKCRLADVETLQDFSYVWTPEATAFFKQLTSNPNLHMEVINFTEDVVYVALRIARAGLETTNVGVEMVAQGHCTSSGESSRMYSNAQTSHRSTRLDDETRRFLNRQKVQAVELTPFREAATEDRNKRTEVKVLYVRQPDEFYVTLPHFQSAIESLQKSVQAAAEAMYQDQVPRIDWKVDDMCYVRAQAQSDSEILWHRGVVTHINSCSSYHVQLRDFGQVVKDVPSTCMANIDKLIMRYSNSAKRCHLHGIQPVGTEWSSDAIQFFKDTLQAYNQIYVKGHGSANKSLSVILWGARNVVSGPFSPARTEFVNINKALVRKNFAAKKIDDNQKPILDCVSCFSVRTKISADMTAVQSWLDKIDKTKDVTRTIEAPIPLPDFEHNEDMPPMELLDDLAKGQATTGRTMPPAGWTTPRKCDKTIFTAIATNVNYECSVYLSLGSDTPYLEHMRNLLVHHYKPLMEKQQELNRSHTYVVGQPVLVTYHMDQLLYRGIVQRLHNKGDYTVYYVDYGNLEKVQADEMLPYAPFPQLNAMCWLVNIHGVRPKGAKYTVTQMDTVHKHLVMKLSSVRVVKPKGVGASTLPTCSIKVENLDIATMMINSGMAISTEPTHQTSTLKSTSQLQGLEAFRIFDELENLAATEPRLSGAQTNKTISSVHQPPAKKKYLVNRKEVDRFETDQDIDCQQAAQEMCRNNSYACAYSDGYSEASQAGGFNNEKDEEEGVAYEMDIDIDDEESSDSPSDEMEMEPFSFSTANPLQRRIDLRHKEIKENISFSPKDTSSVRSYFDGSNSFKTLNLPTGVKEFPCRVDNVISAVELEIAPNLFEYTKHERTLAQETSLFIKEAPMLASPKVYDRCMARSEKDKQWYRASIIEIQESTQQATVSFIDFYDTERVAYTHLKEMPNQLLKLPRRSFRAKLYGVKKNRNLEDKKVRESLRACLCSNPMVYARVHYPFNFHANKSAQSEAEELDLIEVELFENKQKKKLVYQSLIDRSMLITK
ncbi:hypothetical protein KR054_001855, partial [Drosophila jambulina]